MRLLAIALLFSTTAAVAAESDLSVGWIARNPKIDYVWDSANPTVDGWPAEGSIVTWVANVRWLGADPLRGIAYRWTVDGAVVRSGTLDFDPQGVVQTGLPWTWTFARHEIAFEIDPDDAVKETNERNNRLLVYSNALALGLYVERSFWDGIMPKLEAAGIGATTFDDWMQLQVRRFNEMARYAIYPDSPKGVLDRWRIDAIHIVDDGALPLVPPYSEARDWGAGGTGATQFPDVSDHTVDMQWGFPASTVGYWNTPAGEGAWVFTIGNSNVHEWSHARTMIDVYAWNISRDTDTLKLSPAPPADPQSKVVYSTHHHGLMHFNWGIIDDYTAAAMNLMTGWRARRGNYNEPWDLGWFLNDIPASNRVRFLRTDGTAIANSNVSVYRARPDTASQQYGMIFDAPADLTAKTDANGVVTLPRSVFPDQIVSEINDENGTSIVRIDDGSTRRWAFLESLDFNLAYWRGQKEVADYTVTADAPPCVDRNGPSTIQPLPEAVVTTTVVPFQFAATTGHHYDLHYAVDGGEDVTVSMPLPIRSTVKAAVAIPGGRVVWWFIDNDPPVACPPPHSSIYAFDHEVAVPPRRRAAEP